MPFDRQAALEAGYSIKEIDSFLADQQRSGGSSGMQAPAPAAPTFDREGALAAGYTPEEIDGFLSGAQPAAAQPVAMPMQEFQAEVIRRAREPGADAAAIRAFAETVRNPSDPTGSVRYTIGPDLESAIASMQGGYAGPVQAIDATDQDALGAFLRGGLDTGTFNSGDEITAALKATFGEGTYDEYVQRERAQRAIDSDVNGAERMFGEALGTVASTAIPFGKVLEAGGLGAQMLRGSGVGAGMSALAGYGAAQNGEEALDRLPSDLLIGGTLGAGIPVVGKGVSFLRNNATVQGRATSALDNADIDPVALRAAAQDYFGATGKGPRVAEVLGPQGDRLKTSLAAAPETRYRAATEAEKASRDLLAGTRERASSIPLAQAAQDEAALATRARVGEGDLVTPVKEMNRNYARQSVEGFRAGSDSELEAARKALDRANYGAVENAVVNLADEDRIIVGKILEDTPMANATKFGTSTEEGIAQRLEENRLTGLDLQNIRENLTSGSRSVVTKTGQNYMNMAEDLDRVVAANLPELAAARARSFEARSLEEGAATAQAAVKNAGREAADALGDLRTRTPEQMAGVPVGGVQAVLNNTSTTDRAYSFAENLATNPDYAEVTARSLPPGVGKYLQELSTAVKAHVEELESLGMKGVGPSSAKFNAVIGKVLDDPQFAGKLRRLAPQFADEFINYARVQRDFLDRTKALGLDKVADDARKSYAFAAKLESDPAYAESVVGAMPAEAGSELTRYAVQQKKSIDSLAALAGVPPSEVPTVLDNAAAMINIGAAITKGSGGAFFANIVKGIAEGLGVGQGTARKLADNLFDPAEFEKTVRLLEARKLPRSRLDTLVRDSFVKLASDVGKDNTRVPEGAVMIEPAPR